jgi:hypothetical protein
MAPLQPRLSTSPDPRPSFNPFPLINPTPINRPSSPRRARELALRQLAVTLQRLRRLHAEQQPLMYDHVTPSRFNNPITFPPDLDTHVTL